MQDEHGEHRRRFARRRAAATSDVDLVAAIAAGDQAALATVYDREGDRILAVARAVAGPDRAEDVTQDVLVALWQRPERFDPTRGTLRSFLLLQARSRATDMIRSDGSRSARERTAGARSATQTQRTHIEDEVMGQLAGETMHAALATMPSKEHEAIALAYLDGFTYRQVAAALERPEGTVKSQIRCGLARLRTELDGHRGVGWSRPDSTIAQPSA